MRRTRHALLAIANDLTLLNNRLVDAGGVGSAADEQEIERIESRLTVWQVDHSYSDATPAETALAEAAWNLASMLSLVVIDAGAGSWNNEWNQDVDRFSAALDKVPGS